MGTEFRVLKEVVSGQRPNSVPSAPRLLFLWHGRQVAGHHLPVVATLCEDYRKS